MEFKDFNTIASQEIFKAFFSGKVINANDYYDGAFIPSPLFQELTNNLDGYRQMYSLQGYTIESLNAEAFFISRSDRDDELRETAANIQTLLVVICRGIGLLGIAPGILFDPTAGMSIKDVDSIGEVEEIARIVKACGLQLPLTRPVNGILVDRGIMHKTKSERYILSNAGRLLFKELYQSNNSDHEDD